MELRKGDERITCLGLHQHEEDANKGHCRQAETFVKIRKLKKELTKKKCVEGMDEKEGIDEIEEKEWIEEKLITPGDDLKKSKLPLKDMQIGMDSWMDEVNFVATKCFRTTSCRVDDLPIDEIIEAGLATRLIHFLRGDNFSLQYEAAWSLINLTAGASEMTHYIVDGGAGRNLINLLSSQAICLVELCVWALGNIAGDGAEMRDELVENGILKPLLTLVDMKSPATFLRIIAWTISNLCRNKVPSCKMTVLKVLLAPLFCLIQHTDVGVLSHACWGLCHITEGPNNHVEEVVRCRDLMKRLLVLLGSPKVGILTPALRTICNIVSGSDRNIEAFIKLDVLLYLPALLSHRRHHIKRDACSIVARITGISSNKIQTVIDHKLLPLLIEVVKTGDTKSKMEATRAIKHFALIGTLPQVDYLIQQAVFKPLCELLRTKSLRLLLVVLDAIHNILWAASKMGFHHLLVLILYETRTMYIIEDLQSHKNKDIYSKSYGIAKAFFSTFADDLEYDQNLAPEKSNTAGSFQCR